MFDVITFGSATQDIIVRPKRLTVLKYDKGMSSERQEVCFPLGHKIELEDISFYSGGGGTNTAATFSLQGLKTAFCGMIGNDHSGQMIIDELKTTKVDTRFVLKTARKQTNHSIVISGEGQDRTILTYRGAAEEMNWDNIPWKKLKSKWLYLAPLSGELCKNFEAIVNFASENKIKIAVNPGMAQLSLRNFSEITAKIDILILNQEEASFLSKSSDEKEIFKWMDKMCSGVAVITMGGDGVIVSDGERLYSAKPHSDRIIIDTTGAGDAFGSGFVSEIIRSGDIEKAIQLGMANSEGNISELGAKTGLLKKGQKFTAVKVMATPIY